MTNVNYSRELANWLDTIHFDFFCTFTTASEMTLKSARRYMERYHSRLINMGVMPKMFWVAEAHEVKDGYHTHALLSVETPPEMINIIKQNLFEVWQMVSVHRGQKTKRPDGKVFNRCDIQQCEPTKKGSQYLAKYVTKAHADYDLLT